MLNCFGLLRKTRCGLWGGLGGMVLLAGLAQAQDRPLAITAIRQSQTELSITVDVPPGLRKITLESRDRLEAGAWVPRVVARPDGSGGPWTFRLPISRSVELLRVRADATEPLPASFYQGTNTFAGEPTAPGTVGSGRMTFDDSLGAPGAEAGDQSREVVESDLWKVRGDRLFFFNQMRGLQVIDIANPDAPAIVSQLALPAAGEQMYLLQSGHVVLLARASCYYDYQDQSEVLIVSSSAARAEVVARLPVPGYILESRLVGSALYVASQTYRPVPGTGGTTWEWGLAISSFDLADPLMPVARDTLWYAGYGNVVSATDRFLFVVAQEPSDWRQSLVHSIDISDPAGAMRPANTIRPAGRVPDKFKLNLEGDVFTVISEVQTTNRLTRLETFSFADPAQPRWLGGLTLGLSERLHATRFAGNRVYVVTFFVPFQLDPLWVVDLSDPTRPAVLGELEIPGFSTFLHPMGDQLVALGLETNRTTVSLFNVADPAKPSLLSRVVVGEGWAWTEANWNEKAFNVLEEEGLILLPFQSWTDQAYVQQVQLIDLNPDSLVRRGVIDHAFAPRRATVHRNRILSLSARELLTVDATDRDHPVVVTDTELAWSVDRVFVQGAYLIEMETGQAGWYEGAPGALRVALAESPQAVLNVLKLKNELPVLGAAIQNERLYVAQGVASYWGPIVWAEDGTSSDPAPPETNFFLTIVDLTRLPDLPLLGQTALAVAGLSGAEWTAAWPRENLLVWVGGGWNYWRWLDWGIPGAATPDGGLVAPEGRLWWPPWWGGSGGGHLLAFDVAEAASPKPVSELNLGTNGWWSFSRPFAADGSVFLSHQASVFVEDLIVPYLTVTNETKVVGTWVQRHYLDVVDYADPATPTLRPPANIPGQLRGVSRGGALIYTVGYRFDPQTGQSDWTEYLDASGYDRVDVHLIDSLPLPTSWPRPVLLSEETVFLGVPGYPADATQPALHRLETWTVSEEAERFVLLGAVSLADPAQQLAAFPGLLAVQDNRNNLVLFDRSQPAALREIGRGQPAGCLWYDLTKGDGNAQRGLWLPLSGYGVAFIPTRP